jgi:predicted nuclease of predicted toxin-antitoxin system
LKPLLDEMYAPALAEGLRAVGIDARTASELGLAGRSDPDILAAATAGGYALLTENVADFARISAEHLSSGQHHPGVVIALSSRFSRRPAGRGSLVAAIRGVAGEQLEDRTVYLKNPDHGPRQA